MKSQLMIVSADCHATPPLDGYHQYVDSQFHGDLDEWLAKIPARRAQAVAEGFDPALQWTDDLRWGDLDGDGVAAEVLFNQLELAFYLEDQPPGRPDLDMAGVAAMNRFMAELVAANPIRRTAHTSISFYDIDFSVEEIRRGYANGMRGVMLSAPLADFPMYYHPRYDPIWSVCEELSIPIVIHGGAGLPRQIWSKGTDELTDPQQIERMTLAANVQMGPEFTWHARRVLWQLLFGGVLSEHPGLKVVVTEAFADWAPDLMNYLDWMHSGTNVIEFARRRQRLCPELPSKVMRRQVYYGTSSISHNDLAARTKVGVDHMMFGVDYPHLEGTTPHTTQWLQKVFGEANLSEADARLVAGETAADIYGFDTDALAPIVAKVGPDIDTILSSEPVDESLFPDRLRGQYLRPTGM